jgi:5-methyltetrahydropteroyltriglutamate--homocysteine methyltransferase
VGSLLRPEALKRARQAFANGELDANGLRTVEDDSIRDAVAKQQAVGLQAVTDGEFRRGWWHFDFLGGLDGVALEHGGGGIQFNGLQTKAVHPVVTGNLGFGDHPMIDHFRYLASVTSVVPKISIPSPSVLHFRMGRNSISRDLYPDLQAFYADTAEAYRKAVAAFYAAGCRYLQFDDTVWAYLCSEKEREGVRARGDDPDTLPEVYAGMINHALKDKPDDMIVTTHVCRGNFRSSWIAEGGYEPVAEILLTGTPFDGYFLEYDTDRAGGFEPLRFLPPGHKRAVLGLITSKHGELEARDDVLRSIEDATRFAPLEQMCLSPQCGFASTEEGNLLSEQAQWDKLSLVVDLAREVWG